MDSRECIYDETALIIRLVRLSIATVKIAVDKNEHMRYDAYVYKTLHLRFPAIVF